MIESYKRQNEKCVICGKDITKSRRLKTCGCEVCKKEYKHLHYKEALKEKTCLCCGQTFLGTGKANYCESCKLKRRKRKVYEKIKQNVICQSCGKIIRIQYKNLTKTIPENVYEFCDICKQHIKKRNAENSSKRMKQNNPMKNKDVVKKVSTTNRKNYEKKCQEKGITPKTYTPRDPNKPKETKEDTIRRMKLHNPMKNSESVEKMKNTLKQHLESGQVQYKRGSKHPLYKGNRPLNKQVRDKLSDWIKSQLKNANFTCQLCGKTKTTLHVHHNTPLSKIIDIFLEKYNIRTTEEKNDLLKNEKILEQFIQDIIKYHNEAKDIGIVVCRDCHNKIDKCYHKPKNIKNENH